MCIDISGVHHVVYRDKDAVQLVVCSLISAPQHALYRNTVHHDVNKDM